MPLLTALAGVAAACLIIGYFGFRPVAAAIAAGGWGCFLAIVVLHAGVLATCGVAWRVLLPPPRPAPPIDFVWARLIREAGSEVLPLSQLGGFVLGARALVLRGASGCQSIASTMIDVTLEMLSQLLYTGLGFALLLWAQPDSALARPIEIGLVLAMLGGFGFVTVQQHGLGAVERHAQRLAQRWLRRAPKGENSVHDCVRQIYRNGAGLAQSFALHFVCWVATGIEAWVALRLMGKPLGLAAVLCMESLLAAIRSAAFAVPNALGVQEAAYVMLAAVFGFGPETGLALSLLKRGRDLLLGLPCLMLWQSGEGGHLLRRLSIS